MPDDDKIVLKKEKKSTNLERIIGKGNTKLPPKRPTSESNEEITDEIYEIPVGGLEFKELNPETLEIHAEFYDEDEDKTYKVTIKPDGYAIKPENQNLSLKEEELDIWYNSIIHAYDQGTKVTSKDLEEQVKQYEQQTQELIKSKSKYIEITETKREGYNIYVTATIPGADKPLTYRVNLITQDILDENNAPVDLSGFNKETTSKLRELYLNLIEE